MKRLKPRLAAIGRSLSRSSRKLVGFLNLRMEWLIIGWIFAFALAALPRILHPLTPVRSSLEFAQVALPYALIALAPIAGYRMAAGRFPKGRIFSQPAFRLELFGPWRELDHAEASKHRDYGPAGFMASLLVGILLNVPVRSFEFLAAVPAMSARAPVWGTTLFHAMAADVIVMSFVYMVCFVMALRSIPTFPRMLALAWGLDLAMQLAIALAVGSAPGLPPVVSQSLSGLLQSNVVKVSISAIVWIPYLLLSRRANVTFRRRLRLDKK